MAIGRSELDAVERVLAGQLEHPCATRPTSSWPTASCASATAAPQSTGAAAGRPRPRPCTSTSAERRVDAVHRARVRARRCSTVTATWRRHPAPTTTTASTSVDAPMARPSTVSRSPSTWPGASCHRPIAGSTHRGRRRRAPSRARSDDGSSADDVALASPCSSNRSETAARGVDRQRVVPAELGERGVERRRRCAASVGVAQAALEQLEVVAVASSVVPEVEQAAGDDVALDLGAAAVDGGRRE